jgi:succinate dehydrogenase / fumarate reductase flavoprotein subunit
VTEEDVEQSLSRYRRWDESPIDGENFYEIKADMQKVMQNDFGVFRTGEYMTEGLNKLDALQERLNHATLTDKSHVFNTARIEALELDNLMGTARATALSALTRTESRGAHSREDYTERDDQKWIKHSVYFEDCDKMQFRPVNVNPKYVEAFEPKERVY